MTSATESQFGLGILAELSRVIRSVSEANTKQFVESILLAKRIFVAGAGRSGFMSRAFAMRLMQMGFETYVVGETVTPNIAQGDLLVLGTGSGETKSLVQIAEKAKELSASIAIVTIFPESTIGKLADTCVRIPARPKDGSDDGYKSIQPMGTLFEQSLLVFFDAAILKLMAARGTNSDTMFTRHANLE
ncbi:6-phospho-3-hexuloisomerase [Alicyclobacillus fodiniaquatilis]|uniref:6-phospho-3-hexuloisomerase n=1 Tax=Alicyclobacillus fodiniaquatilis TaxID=1661150 RepID=A0ABW4JP95_9BACL